MHGTNTANDIIIGFTLSNNCSGESNVKQDPITGIFDNELLRFSNVLAGRMPHHMKLQVGS